MLIIPIGQEQETVRRTPWVSYTLLAVNFLVTLLLSFGGGEGRSSWLHKTSAALQYLYEHPYLATPPALGRYFNDEMSAELAKARAAATAPTDARRSQEQTELDRLAAEADVSRRGLPSFRLGYIPSEPRAITLVTSMFVHAGWFHLLGNLLFLFVSGPFVEDLYGRPLFAALYVTTGIVATLTHAAANATSTVPLVGASGAIAGVMGAFLVRLAAQRIKLLIIPLPPLFMLRIRATVPAYVVLPLWLAEQVWYAHSFPDAGVAWWAHIGGFAVGALVAGLVRLTRAEERWIHPAIERDISTVQNPGLERATDARVAGDLVRARREIRAVLAAEPQNPDAWTEAWELGLAEGDATAAGQAAQRLLELQVRAGESALAHALITEAHDRLPDALPVRFLMTAAAFLEKEGAAGDALELYREVTERAPQDPATFRAWYRRAEILRAGGDVRGARAAYQSARDHPACVDPWPQTIARAEAKLP